MLGGEGAKEEEKLTDNCESPCREVQGRILGSEINPVEGAHLIGEV